MTSADEAQRQRYEIASIPHHKIPFEFWRDGEYIAFPERTRIKHVMMRWPRGHSMSTHFGLGTIEALLNEVSMDLLKGAMISPMPGAIHDEMKRSANFS